MMVTIVAMIAGYVTMSRLGLGPDARPVTSNRNVMPTTSQFKKILVPML